MRLRGRSIPAPGSSSPGSPAFYPADAAFTHGGKLFLVDDDGDIELATAEPGAPA